MNHYVYRHIRLDCQTPFYVGKGVNKRAFTMSGRNRYHKNIRRKYGYKVQIIKTFKTNKEALYYERTLIQLYKSLGYCEANLTDGGEGTLGYRHTERTKNLLRIPHRAETKLKIGLANKGNLAWNKGIPCDSETKLKISHALKGTVPWNKGTFGICKSWTEGQILSLETKTKISNSLKGRKPWNINKCSFVTVTPNGVFDTPKDAADAHGINYNSVNRNCRNINKTDWYRVPKETTNE